MTARTYVSIGEVLAQLREEFPDVTISKIRFLESQGLVTPQRSPSGYRKFSARDVETLQFILRQQREHFLPLKVIKERVKEHFGEGAPAAPAPTSPEDRAARLERMASVVAALQEGPRDAVPALASLPQAQREEPVVSDDTIDDVAPTPMNAIGLDDLLEISGMSAADVTQAEACGLLRSHRVAGETVYREDAVATAKVLGQFAKFGIEPRHLRTYANAVDREIGLVSQVITAQLRARTPESRQRAAEQASEMAKLGQSLRAALLRRALADLLGN